MIEEMDVIKLEDNKKYLVVDMCEYYGAKYAFLVEVSNKKNIIYVKVLENGVIPLGSDDIKLIYKLSKIFANK